MKTYTQVVITEYNNSGSGVIIFKSKRPVTVNKVHKYLIKHNDFNEERDSFTFCGGTDEIETIEL